LTKKNGRNNRFVSVKSETQSERFDRIYRAIRERICVLEYSPGSILNEGFLAQEFEVSRTPVRSVLQRLNYEGLVTTCNGIGTIVTEVDVKTFRDIYALRMLLAREMSALSPASITVETIDEFRILHKRACDLSSNQPNYKAYAKLCNEYHEQLMKLTENRVLREISDLLYYRAARVWFDFLENIHWLDAVSAVESEMSENIRALEIGDMTGVGDIRRKHLFLMLRTVSDFLMST